MKHLKLFCAVLPSLLLCSCGGEMLDMERQLTALYKDVPFDMPAFSLPSIPSYSICLTDFGAVGDGVTDNTDAFAKAIAHIDEMGGGELRVPAGVWLTGPIGFVNNFCLNVERGAVVLFSADHEKYDLINTTFEGRDDWRCQSPLYAHECHDIAIVGEGVLDGQGDTWRLVKKGKMTDAQWRQLVASGGVLNSRGDVWFPSEGGMEGYYNPFKRNSKDYETLLSVRDFFRPVMLSFRNCKNVLLKGVSFQNSPCWCLHPYCCENVVLYEVSVRNPWYSQNGDGLDLESCSNSIIYRCTFDVGDDAICIKSGRDEEGRRRGMPTQDCLVVDNTVYHGHGGFVVGSEMSGGARRIFVKNCTFLGTDVGLRFKSTRGRGGVVEDIYIKDIQMKDIATEALRFNLYYEGKSPVLEDGDEETEIKQISMPVDETTPIFRKIHIDNVTCNGCDYAMLFNGLPEMKISEVEVRNSTITSKKGAALVNVDGIVFENVGIYPASGEKVIMKYAENVDIR